MSEGSGVPAGAGEEEDRPWAASSDPCPRRGGLCCPCRAGTVWVEWREDVRGFGDVAGQQLPADAFAPPQPPTTPLPLPLGRGMSWVGLALSGGDAWGLCRSTGSISALVLSLSALQGLEEDISPSISSLATQTILLLRAPGKKPSSGGTHQGLCYRLRRAWERWHRPRGAGCVCCWSSPAS